MDYTIVKENELKFIGYCYKVSYDEAYKLIPKLWDEQDQKYLNPFLLLKSKAPSTIEDKAVVDNRIGEFGICFDDNGETIALPTRQEASTKEEMYLLACR